ncbi:MAG: Asp-tRNA(Asn)/Glu-tRNA(Gln) amidotransferase subunit GatC [Acidobacteriaceae bacterium]
MAISTEEVDKIAKLSRLKFKPEEKQKLTEELSGILDYVGELKELSEKVSLKAEEDHGAENLMRDDFAESSEDSEIFLEQSPGREGDFVKVKSILQ